MKIGQQVGDVHRRTALLPRQELREISTVQKAPNDVHERSAGALGDAVMLRRRRCNHFLRDPDGFALDYTWRTSRLYIRPRSRNAVVPA